MKKNLPLILALCIPIAMIIFVAASIYLPLAFISPQDKFIYVVNDRYDYYGEHYEVRDGKIIVVSVPIPPGSTIKEFPVTSTTTARFYMYDAAQDETTEVKSEDINKYTVDSNATSPDGFSIQRGGGNDGIFELFGGMNRDYNTVYLKKGAYTRKIALKTVNQTYYYNNDFRFLGWVINK